MKKRVFCPYYKYSKKTLQIAALFYFYFFGFLMVSWGNWCPNFDLYDNLNPKSNPPWPNFLNHQQRKPNDLTILVQQKGPHQPHRLCHIWTKMGSLRLVLHKVIGSQVKSCFVIYFQILSWRVRKRIIGS